MSKERPKNIIADGLCLLWEGLVLAELLLPCEPPPNAEPARTENPRNGSSFFLIPP